MVPKFLSKLLQGCSLSKLIFLTKIMESSSANRPHGVTKPQRSLVLILMSPCQMSVWPVRDLPALSPRFTVLTVRNTAAGGLEQLPLPISIVFPLCKVCDKYSEELASKLQNKML